MTIPTARTECAWSSESRTDSTPRRCWPSSTARPPWRSPSASTTSASSTGLRDLIMVYLTHRIDVVRRRTVFQLRKAKDRLHLVEGLLIAILDIDEVIQLIRSSEYAASARTRLMEVFDLSELQATYIL